MNIKQLEALHCTYYVALNTEIEQEMLRIMKADNTIRKIIKACGDITIFIFDDNEKLIVAENDNEYLLELMDMDYGYFCLTGYPVTFHRTMSDEIEITRV